MSSKNARCDNALTLRPDASFSDVGQRRDPRMRMQSETAELARAAVQEVDEDERFDQLTQVVWASEPRNYAMRAARGAVDNWTYRFEILNEESHGKSPLRE